MNIIIFIIINTNIPFYLTNYHVLLTTSITSSTPLIIIIILIYYTTTFCLLQVQIDIFIFLFSLNNLTIAHIRSSFLFLLFFFSKLLPPTYYPKFENPKTLQLFLLFIYLFFQSKASTNDLFIYFLNLKFLFFHWFFIHFFSIQLKFSKVSYFHHKSIYIHKFPIFWSKN